MQRRRRPRALTLTLPSRQQPFLLLDGVRYTLRNFNQEGIGIRTPMTGPFTAYAGRRITAELVIENHIYPVELEVVHVGNRYTGLRLLHKSSELEAIFREILEPVNGAEGLVLQPSSGNEDPQSGYLRLWYAGGGEGTELVVWYQEGSNLIQALQLCWLGKVIVRELLKPSQTGYLKEAAVPLQGRRLTADDLLHQHDVADPDLLHEAALVLGALPAPIPGYLLWQFLETGEQVYLPSDALVFPQAA